jgi:hypothetical protein
MFAFLCECGSVNVLGMCLGCDDVIGGVIVLIGYRYPGMSTVE